MWGFGITNPITDKRVFVGPFRTKALAEKEAKNRKNSGSGKNIRIVQRKKFDVKP